MSCTPPDGVVLVDKPSGLTSHDVVARVRRLCGTRRVGHAGTLDPMVTGLLLVGVGRATRLLAFLVGMPKAYAGTIRLGQATTTDDAEGTLTASAGVREGTEDLLPAALDTLRGEILQVPASVSAVKVAGKRAHARVRAGEDVELPARPVTISRLDVVARRPGTALDGTPVLDLEVVVECSSGTYVRALARDLGATLGVGGHLTALRRTAVGPFDAREARTLEVLAGESDTGGVRLATMTDIATRCFPTVVLGEEDSARLRHGAPLAAAPAAGVHAALAPDGHLIALVENRAGAARARLVVDPA